MSGAITHFIKKQKSIARRALATGSRTAIHAKLLAADRIHEAILDHWGIDSVRFGVKKKHYIWFLSEYCSEYKPSYRYRYYRHIEKILKERGVWWQWKDDLEDGEWRRP
ncbi:hypothetical protein [Umboniibacter marinipuniceus]|uniref:Uncharacterized protein n=1 Tax=Umboniibacter marinipuniceus TaxID=569599 RepID=A0A3M0ADV3_9GAMM|nr:hypothetical protein [Umboniibacter marinipuniceus]RMA82716.1 hypothetical protein DFR27_0673 [Umboniibacter marinipuniceus]